MKSEESPQPENGPVHTKRKIYCRQLLAILGFIVVMFIVVVSISTTWEVLNHKKQAQDISELNQKMTEQDQRLNEMQRLLAQRAKQSDGYLYEQLRQFEDNATARIVELEEHYQRQADELRGAKDRISELEEKNMQQQEDLRGAKDRISELEDEVRQLQEDLHTLQTTKAGQSELDHLSNTVSVISQTKVNRTEFNSLSSDVSDLRETVSTKANKDTVVDLTEDVRALEATALNESHYDKLQSGIDMLKWSKVDQTDFEDLVSNVTALAESTVRTKDFLQDALADTQEDLYNATIMISMLQIDFEDIVSNVTSLADSTVKTSEFLQIVHNLGSTTQENISHLTQNFSNQIGTINTTLMTKADKHDVDVLTERVSTLSATTVTLTAFEALEDTVQSLKTSKASQASLDQLETRVNTLHDKTQDLDGLDRKVSSHISSSQQTHEQHDLRISGNDGDIESIKLRIKSVEDDVKQLKDSSPGITASWISMIASTAVSLFIVCVY